MDRVSSNIVKNDFKEAKASETEVFNMTMKIAQQTLEIVKLRNKLTAIEDILKEKEKEAV